MSEILERLKWDRQHVLTGPMHALGNKFVKVYDHAEALEQLLLSLTPGGSEFHGSPEKCAEWIRERQATTGRLAAERNKFYAQTKRLAEACKATIAIEHLTYKALDGVERCRFCDHPHSAFRRHHNKSCAIALSEDALADWQAP